jgi:hypothetical protein
MPDTPTPPGPIEKWLTMQSADQRARHDEARAEVMRLVLELADHPWWKTLPPDAKGPGRIEVNRLARERFEQQALAVA